MVDYPQWVYGPQRGSSWTKSIFSLFLTAHGGTCAQRGCYFSLPFLLCFSHGSALADSELARGALWWLDWAARVTTESRGHRERVSRVTSLWEAGVCGTAAR